MPITPLVSIYTYDKSANLSGRPNKTAVVDHICDNYIDCNLDSNLDATFKQRWGSDGVFLLEM